ncbi:MAG: hypothetical protein SPL71_04525, partial [Oribacterium sp.]|nr:hypothetical protein [Oribacterium sp.]
MEDKYEGAKIDLLHRLVRILCELCVEHNDAAELLVDRDIVRKLYDEHTILGQHILTDDDIVPLH